MPAFNHMFTLDPAALLQAFTWARGNLKVPCDAFCRTLPGNERPIT